MLRHFANVRVKSVQFTKEINSYDSYLDNNVLGKGPSFFHKDHSFLQMMPIRTVQTIWQIICQVRVAVVDITLCLKHPNKKYIVIHKTVRGSMDIFTITKFEYFSPRRSDGNNNMPHASDETSETFNRIRTNLKIHKQN